MSDHFNDIVAARLSRRTVLGGFGGAAVLAAASPAALLAACGPSQASPLGFREIGTAIDPHHHVSPGYRADVLVRWGDPVTAQAQGPFDPQTLTREGQQQRFGYNCDFVGYLPLADGETDRAGHLASQNASRGLLCVNHEFNNPELMFPGYASPAAAFANATESQIGVLMAALGHSVVEIARKDGRWGVVANSRYGRRIDAFTEIALTGPAAGDARLKTSADPSGTLVQGTFHNCAGGVTPWGTVLSAEENFHQAFGGSTLLVPLADLAREGVAYEDYRIGGGNIRMPWIRAHKRFDIAVEPNEPNRYGWIVEIDPYDPASTPKKRTALGRFAHEAATVVAKPGRPAVIYMGDDARNQFIYKFVTAAPFDPAVPNLDLLDQGTLYVARFAADGAGRWLPLVHGQGPLTAENGFRSQADVLIEARRAARRLGATPMDRPEDIETSPRNGRTYAVMTSNTERAEAGIANPRSPNPHGHILEITPPGTDAGRDHTADTFAWEIFLLAGDPANAAAGARYGAGLSQTGWISNPDNIVFDPKGRLWIATDGADDFGIHDGIWACETDGAGRAVTRHFFGCPVGAEMCGPCFTPDGKTLFVAVQHPAQGSVYAGPSTRWPDFAGAMPPRPSVVAIVKEDGGDIGS